MNSVKHALRVLWVKEIFRPVSGLTIPKMLGKALSLGETFPSSDSGHSPKALGHIVLPLRGQHWTMQAIRLH
jgi:hypothetical protein